MANPLYPGYYPGKPVYRDRRPFSRPQPTELGGLDQVMSEIRDRVHDNLNIPKWLIDQEMKSIKSAFSISAAEEDPETKQYYGVEDVEEQTGASVSMELDFRKFFEDPEKYLTETFITGPWNSISDIDEYQGAARGEIIRELVADKRSPFYLGIEGVTSADVKEATEAIGPVSLDQALHAKYGDLGVKAMSFSSSSVSTKSRNGSYNSFNQGLLETVGTELSWKETALAGGAVDASTAAKINDARNLVTSRSSVVSSLKSLDSQMGTVGKKMRRKGDQDFFSPLGGAATVDPAAVQDLKNKIQHTRDSLNQLSVEDRRAASNVDSYLNSLESGLDRYVDFTSGKIKDAKGLDLFLKTEGSKLYRGDFDQGIAGSLTSKFARDTANNKTVRSALSSVDSNGDRIFSSASLHALNLSKDLQTDWDYETLDDLISSIKGGKIPTQFIYKRVILPRIERYTPSFWIKRGVDWYTQNTATGQFVANSLKAYGALWTNLQKKLPIIGIFGSKNLELLKKKIANWIAEAITKAIDLGTEGLGILFDRIIKVVVRFVVEKTMDLAVSIWKAAIKLDFDEIEKLLGGSIKALLPFVAGCITPFAFLAVVVFFIITIFVGVLPQEDATKEPGPIGALIERLLPWFGGFSEEDCPLEDVLSLPFPNDSENLPAFEAFELVVGLKRGFWCYWNHQPSYDDAADRIDLFDEIQFEYNAFPAALNECADCLFWCTWLPYVAYQNVGMEFDKTISYLGAQRMNDWFKSQAASGSFTYIEPDDPTACDSIEDGDIVFWNVGAGTGWHVSMVYNKGSGVINTIHSNAPYKWLPLMCSGGTVQDPPGGTMTVVGFGRPSK